MHRRIRTPLGLVLAIAGLAGCSSDATPPRSAVNGSPDATLVDVGGYGLWHACVGTGSPTVILDAGLGAAGSSEWPALIDALANVHTRVCTYDRPGNGLSDPRPADHPTAAAEADELERLLEGADIAPPYVLVPHSFAGLIAREFADRYPEQVAGFVFEDVSTAWEIELWPRWDPSPWIDGGQRVDIEATRRQVLDADRLGDRPTIVVSQTAYDEEGIPTWAGPIFARQQDRLAALGNDVIHVRVERTGHFIHREHPDVMVDAIAAVVDGVRGGSILPRCPAVFTQPYVDCVSGP